MTDESQQLIGTSKQNNLEYGQAKTDHRDSVLSGDSIKISFTDLNYSVTVKTSKEQQQNGEPAQKEL